MKKILSFFLFIPIFACSNINFKDNQKAAIDCPSVFFSSENNVYIDGEKDTIDLEKINYKATLNNYGFVNGCYSNSKRNIYSLDLLVLIEPLNPSSEIINLPIFVLMYGKNGNLIGKQYFRIKENFLKIDDDVKYQIEDFTTNINIISALQNKVNSLTIGFVNIK